MDYTQYVSNESIHSHLKTRQQSVGNTPQRPPITQIHQPFGSARCTVQNVIDRVLNPLGDGAVQSGLGQQHLHPEDLVVPAQLVHLVVKAEFVVEVHGSGQVRLFVGGLVKPDGGPGKFVSVSTEGADGIVKLGNLKVLYFII